MLIDCDGNMLEESDAKKPTYWLTKKTDCKIGHIIISHGTGINTGDGYNSMPFSDKKELIKYCTSNQITLDATEYVQ